MRAVIKSQFNLSAGVAWDLVQQSKTLTTVCKGMLSFDGSEFFPDRWQEGAEVHTRLRLFGCMPAWRHVLRFKLISDTQRILLTEESGGIVSVWEHEIKVTPIDENHCLYSDIVEIQAGILTPVVWLFAHVLYRYRQRRWRRLA